MENEIEDKSAGVLRTKEVEEGIKITIQKQTRYDFDDSYLVLKGKMLNAGESGRKVLIASENCVEYISGCSNIQVFLKGRRDSSERNKSFIVDKDDWIDIKPCLEASGFLIDKKEVKEESSESIDLSNKLGEPSEEEINKMISLVDTKTFIAILKNRLFYENPSYKKEIAEFLSDDFIKKYLRTWAINKYRFYKLFGEKLSISKEVKIEATSEMIGHAINDIKNQFPLYSCIFGNFADSAIRDNKIDKTNAMSKIFDDKRVKEGMKFTKMISLYGNKDLDMEISKLYQNLGKCNITISINPIDYLTVSINNSGWKSCHNFFDGCYRNATLGYLFDKTSMVAYSSGKDVRYSMEIPFEWNSKNWRQMIYVSENSSATAFSRQYPNSNDGMAKEVRNLFEEIFSEYFGVENKWKVYNCVENGDVRVRNNSIVYNDIENGYPHKLIKNTNDVKYKERDEIYIGHDVYQLNKDNEARSDSDLWW